jgi:hypothetical protein
VNVPALLGSLVAVPRLPFLVIGGYAVAAHGYPRLTYDLDMMIARSTAEEWKTLLAGQGFRVLAEQTTFVQFARDGDELGLDLMLVSDETFRGLMVDSQPIRFGATEARVPSLDHLLALKLHVLKQDLRHRVAKDLNDVIMLVLKNGLDIRQEKYEKLFLKYGNAELYDQTVRATRPE